MNKKGFSAFTLLALYCVSMGTASATGPTAVEPVSWQKAGVGLSFDGGNPTWVTGWADESGNGNDLALGLGHPLHRPGELNGEPILGFGFGEGTTNSDQLRWPANPLAGVTAGTGFIVVRALESRGGGDVWNLGSSGGANPWASSGPTPAGIPYVYEDFGSTTRPLLINDKWMAFYKPERPFVKYGEWYIYTVTIGPDGGDVVMRGYVDGIKKEKVDGLSVGWQASPTVGDFGDAKTIIDVAEILLYDAVLSAAEINDVVAYLGEKFGLVVAPPIFSPDGGVFNSPQTVTITCGLVGATIRYTIDSTDPSETHGTIIASGNTINISSDTVLKAIAYKAGLPNSEVNQAPFAFADIPAEGLTAWAKSGFGIKFAGAPNHVDEWLDASGNGNDLINGPWAGRPLYKPGQLNGEPFLGFGFGEGTTCCDELYYIGTYHNGFRGIIREPLNPLVHADAATGFLVLRSFLNTQQPPFGGQVWDMGDYGGGVNHWAPPEVFEDFGCTTRPRLINDPTLQYGEWYVYVVTIGGPAGSAEMKGYVNGELKGSVGGLTVQFYEIGIGDNNPIAQNAWTVANVAEILLYDRVLSDFERTRVTNYLGVKFGILEGTTLTASLPGDCNQDGAFDLSDAVCLLGFIFQSTPPVLPCSSTPANVALMDCNGDGAIDISDAVYKLNFLFQGGPPPEQETGCIQIVDCPANEGCP